MIASKTNGHPGLPLNLSQPPDIQPPEESTVTVEPGAVLSPSQVNCFLECPAKWYFKYLLGLREPLNSNLALGRAVDDALCHYYRTKAEGEELRASDVLEAYDLAWADQEAEATFGEDEEPDKIHELGRRLVECYLTDIAGLIDAAVIESKAAVQLPVEGGIAGVRVRGYIDLLTDDGMVVDMKTKRDKPSEVPPDHMLQITTYDLLCPHSRGRGQLHYMVKGRSAKSKVRAIPFTRDIGPAETLYAESVYPAVQESMRDGVYLPRRTSRLCSRKYCPFWERCEAEFGGTVG